MNRPRVYLPAIGLINALGGGVDAISGRLFAGDTAGMVLEPGWLQGAEARVGRVGDAVPTVPADLSRFACRNNGLLIAAVDQIVPDIEAAAARYGRHRIGIVLGTSTSGIAEGEAAVAAHRRSSTLPNGYRYTQQEIGMPAVFLSRLLEICGPAFTVSTACTSSAKAFGAARRLIRAGLCDAVIAGGVDSLCRLTINGFTALESTTPRLTNPLSRNRCGINIGEGAAVFLLSREESAIELLGIGESSDAHHISSPHPDGAGAESAMRAALANAGLSPHEIGYLNLHATGTVKNDAMESQAVARVFPDGVPASGSKPLTGHTLGAAGATELAFCWIALRSGVLVPHVWDGEADPELPALDLVAAGRRFAGSGRRAAMSNSFAFGGNNAVLVIGDAS